MMKFQIVDKSISVTNGDGEDILHIRGIANTGQKDLVGDTLTENALLNVCEQATQHNLHLDHDTSFDGVLGPITRAELVEDGVVIEADVLGEKAKEIRVMLEHGVKLGLSVSGIATSSHSDENMIIQWDLTEISLTPIPCDQATMGSVSIVKSFNDIVQIQKKQMEKENMAEETSITLDKVIELINEAFNERREEFLETIRAELKTEYEAALNELKERIETIENSSGEGEEEIVEPVPTGEEAGIVSDSVEEEEEPKPEEEEAEEEDKSVNLAEQFEELLDKKLKEVFKTRTSKDMHFQSSNQEEEEEEEEETPSKKSFTPREIAHILANK